MTAHSNSLFRLLPIVVATWLLASCAGQRRFDPDQVAGRFVRAPEWGGTAIPADARLRPHTIRQLTLHHGGEDFPPAKDVPQHLRNLQAWSRREKRWADIPYHFIVDLQGRIYACRPLEFAGDTNTEYDPAGHALVCVLGNYQTAAPSPAQLAAIMDLFAWLCETHGLGPETIAGHKDHSAQTDCPGKNLHAQLANGRIRAGVEQRLRARRNRR
jgi:hypothetical protein